LPLKLPWYHRSVYQKTEDRRQRTVRHSPAIGRTGLNGLVSAGVWESVTPQSGVTRGKCFLYQGIRKGSYISSLFNSPLLLIGAEKVEKPNFQTTKKENVVLEASIDLFIITEYSEYKI